MKPDALSLRFVTVNISTNFPKHFPEVNTLLQFWSALQVVKWTEEAYIDRPSKKKVEHNLIHFDCYSHRVLRLYTDTYRCGSSMMQEEAQLLSNWVFTQHSFQLKPEMFFNINLHSNRILAA